MLGIVSRSEADNRNAVNRRAVQGIVVEGRK